MWVHCNFTLTKKIEILNCNTPQDITSESLEIPHATNHR